MVQSAQGTVLLKRWLFNFGPDMIRVLLEMDQITIAAINGEAMGGGACIVSALDFRIGAADWIVGFSECGLGIPLSWVSLPLCVHLVGSARAKRWIIKSERLGSNVLEKWGSSTR
ncbi:MAG: enoyl-CoA hydratase/isomerase family protein [Actinomycetota bacterium]|nr:enoyl-CoA hydratase/isomerase family protein [Actinomycetota bacterium]